MYFYQTMKSVAGFVLPDGNSDISRIGLFVARRPNQYMKLTGLQHCCSSRLRLLKHTQSLLVQQLYPAIYVGR
jgi:hypothetical protein